MEKKVKKSSKKSLEIKFSGRSTDYISPSFAFGCGYNCSYCYCKRHVPDGITFYGNTEEILTEIDHHAMFATDDKPNQTDERYITYDIGCNTDIVLHAKQLPIVKIFNFFKHHPVAKASFATKAPYNPNLAAYASNFDYSTIRDPRNNKIRIRMSLIPQKYSSILEPNTASIEERIDAIYRYMKDGFEVHVNFSPVIVTDTWIEDYTELFLMLDKRLGPNFKKYIKCEVIFLTHNEKKHNYNVENNLPGEDMLWKPDIQETKTSQYGGVNIRYKHELKAEYIYQFKQLHNLIIPWCTIRYIF
jgi:spore photoproduct lyase